MMEEEQLRNLGMLADLLEQLADDEDNNDGGMAMLWSGIFRRIDKVRETLERMEGDLRVLKKKQEGLE